MTVGMMTVMALIGYLGASVFYGSLLLGPTGMRRPLWLAAGRTCGLVGVFVHTSAIGLSCAQTHHTPFTTAADTVSATGWALAIAYLVVEALMRQKPPIALGALSFPLSFLAVFTGSVLSARHPATAIAGGLDSRIVSVHVTGILFAFALLFLAVCCAVIYLIEDSLLKRKKVVGGLFSRLPPMNTVDGLAFTLVTFAFPLLTVSLAAGFIRAVVARLAFADFHTAMSLVTWLIFGVYLWMHSSPMGRGVKANTMLLFGLAAALITYFVQSSVHHFA